METITIIALVLTIGILGLIGAEIERGWKAIVKAIEDKEISQ